MVKKVNQAPPAILVKKVNQAPQAELVNQAKMVVLVPLVVPVMLAPQAVQARLAVQALQETQAKTAPQAAANTAHRLVWPQVIKRRRLPSQAKRQIGRRLGRLFINDKNHHFVQNIYSFTAFSLF